MSRRKLTNLKYILFYFIIIIFIFFLVKETKADISCSYCKNGQCNGVCEINEDTTICFDCTSAYCGNGYCDPGKGENSDNCWEDCKKANGESCTFDLQCLSRHCCGSLVIKFMMN